ncbi:MAG: hypothetical protein LUF85_05300 [Bacteroides sp.]|nr:hypothetical protein [Bacteroides sp.]
MNNKDILQRVVRYLILNASFTNQIGLLRGKMGIAIFFYEYSAYTKMKFYADFAWELIEEIYEKLQNNLPLNLRDGLPGICWGIEYLLQNKFINADEDILEELDAAIVERDIRRVVDPSLETGLNGLAHYVLARCRNKKTCSPSPKTI